MKLGFRFPRLQRISAIEEKSYFGLKEYSLRGGKGLPHIPENSLIRVQPVGKRYVYIIAHRISVQVTEVIMSTHIDDPFFIHTNRPDDDQSVHAARGTDAVPERGFGRLSYR